MTETSQDKPQVIRQGGSSGSALGSGTALTPLTATHARMACTIPWLLSVARLPA